MGAVANNIVLTHADSVVAIDPISQAGVFDWEVSGADHLQKEWWWLRVNGQRFSVDALGAPTVDMPEANAATTTYTDPVNQYSIEISYALTGTDFASGESLLKESVTIFNNNPASALDISLFLYTDLDLGGTSSDDSVSLQGRNDSSIFGTDIGWYEADQSDSANSHTAIFNFRPVLGELGVGTSTLDKLNNTTLDLDSDAGLVLTPTSGASGTQEFGPVGPADVTWAVQYDFQIAPNDSAGMGVDKRLVVTPIPEPTAAAFGLLGLATLLGISRSRRA